jgi:hypothetical protein
LRETQEWFARAVMTGEAMGEAEARLTAGPNLGARGRLEVYRRGYAARLRECLADDYPVLKHAMGAEAFDELGDAYVARFPSTSPNLNAYGRHMAAFCAEGGRCFEADLARLEWAVVEVIHAPLAPLLTMDRLAAVPPEAWGRVRLVASRALRIVEHEHPVNDYFQSVRDGRSPNGNGRNADDGRSPNGNGRNADDGRSPNGNGRNADGRETTVPDRAPGCTAVYRSSLTVWRMGLTPPMAAVLRALVAGTALESALAHAHSEPESSVTSWFRDWITGGLFVDVVTSPG